jgi:TP901 family phage tail tape measure protein
MVSPTIDKIQRKATTFGHALEVGFNNGAIKLERLNSAIRSTAATTVAWGLAIGIPMANILKTGAQFEDTLIRAFAKLDEKVPYGTERFKELKMAILGATKGTEFTGIQAAESFRELAGAGYAVDKAIGALTPIFKAARVSQMELNETSVRMVDLLKAFNLESDDADKNTRSMARAANILAKADAMGTTNMRQLFEAIQNGGSAAVRAGADLETFAAMAINLADIKGFEAGTGLKLVFNRLIPVEENKAKLMKLLDISMEDKKTKKLRDYVDVLEELDVKLRSKSQYQRSKIISILFGQEGMAAGKLMEVFKALPGKVRSSRDELRGMIDTLDRVSEELQNSPMFQWQQALKQVDDMKLKLYEIVKGPAREALTKLQNWMGNPENQARLVAAMSKFADHIPQLADALLKTVEYLPELIKVLVALKASELVMKGGRGLSGLWNWLTGLAGGAMGAAGGKAALAGAGSAAMPATSAAAASAVTYTSFGAVVKSWLTKLGSGMGVGIAVEVALEQERKNRARVAEMRASWQDREKYGPSAWLQLRREAAMNIPWLYRRQWDPQVVPQQSRPQTNSFRFYTDNPNLRAEPMPNSWEPGGLNLIQAGAF